MYKRGKEREREIIIFVIIFEIDFWLSFFFGKVLFVGLKRRLVLLFF